MTDEVGNDETVRRYLKAEWVQDGKLPVRDRGAFPRDHWKDRDKKGISLHRMKFSEDMNFREKHSFHADALVSKIRAFRGDDRRQYLDVVADPTHNRGHGILVWLGPVSGGKVGMKTIRRKMIMDAIWRVGKL